jgi:hypothetical protein
VSLSMWKIQRELRRVGSQLLEPYRQIRDAFLRVDYRMRHSHHVQHFDGDIKWTERVAVFLVYQPNGIPDSVVATCKHLSQQGYACVLVSNGNLIKEDLQRLMREVVHVIVRPNFGYDFGGYQEAVIWLRQQGTIIQSLLLMNDSVWFPVLRNSDFLCDMVSTGADIVGALSAQRGRTQRHQRKLFYASFMLLFSEKAVNSEKFWKFWDQYRQTSSKSRTIRLGERKLSALFIHDENYTHRAMVDHATYLRMSFGLDAHTWPVFANELALSDLNFEVERKALIESHASNVVDLWNNWYSRLCESQNIFSCAQGSLVLRMCVPFVKKSKDPQNIWALQRSLNAFGHANEFEPRVLQEMQSLLNMS